MLSSLLLVAGGLWVCTAQQRVGVNTENPEATLHVAKSPQSDGNMRVRDVKIDGKEPLVWNPQTKEVGVGSSETNKPLYLLKYKIKCNESQDLVADFDTKIPADKYYVFITRAEAHLSNEPGNATYFNIPNKSINTGMSHVRYSNNKELVKSLNPFQKVKVFVKDGTWRITANYLGSNPQSYYNAYLYWNFDLFVVNKRITNGLGSKEIDASANGTATDETSILKSIRIIKMKKLKYTIFVLLFSVAFGQLEAQKVGINTEEPYTTLDIRGDLKVDNPVRYDNDGSREVKRLHATKESSPEYDRILSIQGDESYRPMYTFTMHIDTKKSNGDNAQNIRCQTNMNLKTWYLFATHAELYDLNFGKDGGDLGVAAPAAMSHTPIEWKKDKGNPLNFVRIYEGDGFSGEKGWWFSAAYPNAVAFNKSGYDTRSKSNGNVYQWRIGFVAVRKESMKDIDVNKVDNNGQRFKLKDFKGAANQNPFDYLDKN